jgi:hypothetical protein
LLKKIFGPKRDKVTGVKITPPNEELHNVYSTKYLWDIRWAEHVAFLVNIRNAYTILVGNPSRKKQLGRHE